MSEPTRRPLPALVFMLALTVLAALVWWRVLHRPTNQAPAASPCPTSVAQTALPKPGSVRVQVLNSTNRTGIAKSVAATLTKDGFTVSGYGNDTTGLVRGVAQIRYGPQAAAAAKLLAYYLPGSALVPTTTPSAVDVVISLGSAYKLVTGQAAVQRAIASVPPSTAPATPSGSPSC